MILNELGERGINSVLQSRLNMVGDAPAPSLVPEVQSALVLENDRPEWAYYKGEALFSAYLSEAGGGANYTSALLEAPLGHLAVIESITINLGVGDWELGWVTSLPAYGLTSIANVINRDARMPVLTGFSFITGTTAASPAFAGGTIARIPNNTGYDLRGPWILADGKRALLLKAAGTNYTLRATIKGYYRRLLPNELV